MSIQCIYLSSGHSNFESYACIENSLPTNLLPQAISVIMPRMSLFHHPIRIVSCFLIFIIIMLSHKNFHSHLNVLLTAATPLYMNHMTHLLANIQHFHCYQKTTNSIIFCFFMRISTYIAARLWQILSCHFLLVTSEVLPVQWMVCKQLLTNVES